MSKRKIIAPPMLAIAALATLLPLLPALPDTEHSGSIITDQIWGPLGNTHVVNGIVTVSDSAQLTILPGTVVKFLDSESQLLISNGGSTAALGNEDSNIVFTSFKDDSLGGDSNGDGSATYPEAGDWRNISIDASQYGTAAAACNVITIWDTRAV